MKWIEGQISLVQSHLHLLCVCVVVMKSIINSMLCVPYKQQQSFLSSSTTQLYGKFNTNVFVAHHVQSILCGVMKEVGTIYPAAILTNLNIIVSGIAGKTNQVQNGRMADSL